MDAVNFNENEALELDADKVIAEEKKVRKFRFFDAIFKKSLGSISLLFVAFIIAIFLTLLVQSLPSIKALGFDYFTHSKWDPITLEFGSLSFLTGTLVTSFLALVITIPFSLSVSLLLGEYYPRGFFSNLLRNCIELLGGIPSIIYGFWGLFFLVPIMRGFEAKIGVPPLGIGVFTTSFLLFIMIIPYSAALGRDVISLVPADLKQAALALGCTKYEVIKLIIIPYAKSGIFAGILLALGRALGETMAVTMVIGNRNAIPDNLFGPANTMASVIANEFTEAASQVYLSSLVEMGLLLFVVTAIISFIGKQVINRFSKF